MKSQKIAFDFDILAPCRAGGDFGFYKRRSYKLRVMKSQKIVFDFDILAPCRAGGDFGFYNGNELFIKKARLFWQGFSVLLIFLVIFIPLAPIYAEEIQENGQIIEQGSDKTIEHEEVNTESSQPAPPTKPEQPDMELKDLSVESVDQKSLDEENIEELFIIEITEETNDEGLVAEEITEGDNANDVIENDFGIFESNFSQESGFEEAEIDEEIPEATSGFETSVINLEDQQDEQESAFTTQTQELDENIVVLESEGAEEQIGQDTLLESEINNQESAISDSQELENIVSQLREEIINELKQGCLDLEDGSYYCINSNTQLFDSQNANPENIEVFSKKDDKEGDGEIYFKNGDSLLQITNNFQDDLFPAKDIFGTYVVWQSLVNDRWQIFIYDLEAQATTQLTFTNFNNMNPHISGDFIVWQGWVENNWEIFLAKKTSNPAVEPLGAGGTDSWVIQQLTNNTWHDMFPKIAGGLVTWQGFVNGSTVSASEGGQALQVGSWQVFIHNPVTEETFQLSAGDGKHENPRFMIVWEEREEDGSVQKFGYDLSSGQVIELENETPVPAEIPEPSAQEDATVPARTEFNTADPQREEE